MRVAIDGQFRTLPPSGTGAYLQQLLDALPVAAPDIEREIIDPDDAQNWPRHYRMLPGVLGRDLRFRRLNWEALGFAKAAEQHPGIELLHIPSMAAPVRSSIPFVVTVHDAIPFVLPEYRASRAMQAHLALMRRSVGQASLVLTPSRAAALDLVSVLGIPAGKIRVTPEAADPNCTPVGEPSAIAEVKRRFGITGPYCFNVGGLDSRKRVDLLVEAFARALPDLPDGAQLVIGGNAHSGNPVVYPPIDPVIARFGARDRVILTGWLSETDKIALYQGAMVYATPSIYEGFGLTALEAMACGAPVIAANRTSLPEVVGESGLLIEPNAEAFRQALTRIMNDEKMRGMLRSKGLEQSGRFSWVETARLTAGAYREAVEMTAISA